MFARDKWRNNILMAFYKKHLVFWKYLRTSTLVVANYHILRKPNDVKAD